MISLSDIGIVCLIVFVVIATITFINNKNN